jgi:hypothetical protein
VQPKYVPLLLLVVAVTSFFIGEGGRLDRDIQFVGLITVIGMPIAGMAMRKWLAKCAAAMAVLLAAIGFSLLGDQSFKSAYSDCLAGSERLHWSLAKYHVENGRYPDSLDRLNVVLPCGRATRASLLRYKRIGDSYQLLLNAYDPQPAAPHLACTGRIGSVEICITQKTYAAR